MKTKKEARIAKTKLEQQRGITLVALVVTIVVLIILSTVSISAVFSENGIIRKAELARDYQANAIKADEEDMNRIMSEYNNAIAEPPEPPAPPAPPDNRPLVTTIITTDHGTIIAKDTLGNQVVVPAGFKIHSDSANVVNEGIVITDGTNEFVWVPVSEASFANMFKTAEPKVGLSGSTNVTSSYYSNLRKRSGDSYTIATVENGAYSSTSAIREPDLVTTYDENTTNKYYEQAGYGSATEMAQRFVEDYKNMRASIEKYKGFYIGRYELTGTVENPTVKAGAVLTADLSQAKNWYGLYKASRNVVTGNSHAVSTMIWGCQWDETMNWLKNTKFQNNQDAVDTDSSSWGNYNNSTGNAQVKKEDGTTQAWGSPQNTGYSGYWSANKIYDLAGNYLEWTQEAYNKNSRICRGRWL